MDGSTNSPANTINSINSLIDCLKYFNKEDKHEHKLDMTNKPIALPFMNQRKDLVDDKPKPDAPKKQLPLMRNGVIYEKVDGTIYVPIKPQKGETFVVIKKASEKTGSNSDPTTVQKDKSIKAQKNELATAQKIELVEVATKQEPNPIKAVKKQQVVSNKEKTEKKETDKRNAPKLKQVNSMVLQNNSTTVNQNNAPVISNCANVVINYNQGVGVLNKNAHHINHHVQAMQRPQVPYNPYHHALYQKSYHDYIYHDQMRRAAEKKRLEKIYEVYQLEQMKKALQRVREVEMQKYQHYAQLQEHQRVVYHYDTYKYEQAKCSVEQLRRIHESQQSYLNRPVATPALGKKRQRQVSSSTQSKKPKKDLNPLVVSKPVLLDGCIDETDKVEMNKVDTNKVTKKDNNNNNEIDFVVSENKPVKNDLSKEEIEPVVVIAHDTKTSNTRSVIASIFKKNSTSSEINRQILDELFLKDIQPANYDKHENSHCTQVNGDMKSILSKYTRGEISYAEYNKQSSLLHEQESKNELNI